MLPYPFAHLSMSFGCDLQALNFTEAESRALYSGAKALGVSPFACFTYAAHRACTEVLHQPFLVIAQQANLQARHFPTAISTRAIGGLCVDGHLVGDWLVGPVTRVNADYNLQVAQAGYESMKADVDKFGPKTQKSFMAKAYGLVNCGAGQFQTLPTYNDDAHVVDCCLLMNNYGVRSTANPALEAWNWCAPLWLGINTINVNGRTTTLIGSCMWGLEVIEALRDHIEGTLREIMACAPEARKA